MILQHQLGVMSDAMEDLETEVFGEVHFLDEYDTDELVAVWEQFTDIVAAIYRAKSTLDGELMARLDRPRVLSDGKVMNPKREAKRTRYRKPDLLDELYRRYEATLIDPETGERTTALSPDVVKYLDVAVGRTRAWADIGIDLDDFCDVEWVTKLEVKKL